MLIHVVTVELAFPITMANDMLKRVRELFDAEKKKAIIMTSTYRSGINIKFGRRGRGPKYKCTNYGRIRRVWISGPQARNFSGRSLPEL